MAACRTSRAPAASASAGRVTSSCVGPSPPVTITTSALEAASSIASTIRGSLSPTT
jgi:hypothetical protein